MKAPKLEQIARVQILHLTEVIWTFWTGTITWMSPNFTRPKHGISLKVRDAEPPHGTVPKLSWAGEQVNSVFAWLWESLATESEAAALSLILAQPKAETETEMTSNGTASQSADRLELQFVITCGVQ